MNLRRYQKNKVRKISLWIALISILLSSVIYEIFTEQYQTCRDGWDSPSIGIRGAGSHHGGIVTRTRDNRPLPLLILNWFLNLVGFTSTIFFIYILVTFNREPYYELFNEIEKVPLRIGDITKKIEIKRINDNTYESTNEIALIRDPTGKRISVFTSKIEFIGSNNKFRQNLKVLVYTNRGNSYYAEAFKWNS